MVWHKGEIGKRRMTNLGDYCQKHKKYLCELGTYVITGRKLVSPDYIDNADAITCADFGKKFLHAIYSDKDLDKHPCDRILDGHTPGSGNIHVNYIATSHLTHMAEEYIEGECVAGEIMGYEDLEVQPDYIFGNTLIDIRILGKQAQLEDFLPLMVMASIACYNGYSINKLSIHDPSWGFTDMNFSPDWCAGILQPKVKDIMEETNKSLGMLGWMHSWLKWY